MSHTFEIRFERAAGLAGLLAAPANSFRWKGAGQLRIDREGISFAVKRGLLRLFPLERRVAAANLEEVYREGEALHLSFTAADTSRASVSCWAADADTAGKIVELLPTRRTVELEHVTRTPQSEHPRYDRRALWLLLTFTLALTGGAWLLVARHPWSPVPVPLAAPLPLQTDLAPPVIAASAENFIRAIPRQSPHFAIASRQLELFEKESAALLADYRLDREMLESGAMKWQTFAERLGILEARWWTVSYRILEDSDFAALELAELRATLLASARQWRAFLEMYAQGLNAWDPKMVTKSFDELARADELQARARLYVR